ncbi:MAG: hypothetical protein RBT39_09775 [Azoarcus sp.]|jgi:hypothetical protein|nr:hypothetical protein [Azoarcus sp.]MDD2873313.1 hypothetical protein [Azoarcus sp.]MDX9837837.1 hypothetical protein [Azoarcus sp.]
MVKLVNDGYSQAYRSDETTARPKWAVWKDEAFGTSLDRELGSTFRPIRIGAGLLTYLDQLKGRNFLIQWRNTIAPPP